MGKEEGQRRWKWTLMPNAHKRDRKSSTITPSSSNITHPQTIHYPLRDRLKQTLSTSMIQAFTRSWKTSRPQRTFRTQTKEGYVSQIFKRQVYEVVSRTNLPSKSPNYLLDQTTPEAIAINDSFTKTIRVIIKRADPSNKLEEAWAHDYLVATLPSRIKLQQIRIKKTQTQSKTQARKKKTSKGLVVSAFPRHSGNPPSDEVSTVQELAARVELH